MTEIITTVQDLRKMARRRIPRVLFEYIDRGSWDELTLARNRSDMDAIRLRQRVLKNVEIRSLETTLLGQPVTLPLVIAPTGLAGLLHRDGEIRAACAAEQFGIPFCLSTVSICSIEDVRSAVSQPFWFQLYVMKDRGFCRSLIERARAAQCSALVVTVDVALSGQRHRDTKNGLTVPPRLSRSTLLNMVSKPAWCLGMLRSKRRNFGNLEGQFARGKSVDSLARWVASQFDPSFDLAGLEWIRSLWPGKLVVKGILDPIDANAVVALGADALVVSNHGGRQLDGADSSIAMLPEIFQVVGNKAELLFDSGIQSGQDMIKALALGARGCLIGKAFLYGLAAMGEKGVRTVLEILRAELDITMALCGVCDVQSIDSDIVRRR
jgi:L-lactate dehydrogenase (cytochrome)